MWGTRLQVFKSKERNGADNVVLSIGMKQTTPKSMLMWPVGWGSVRGAETETDAGFYLEISELSLGARLQAAADSWLGSTVWSFDEHHYPLNVCVLSWLDARGLRASEISVQSTVKIRGVAGILKVGQS